jgi:apolipoprotein N-acyltransferase
MGRGDSQHRDSIMEGLAGRVMLLWGWRRTLVAFLAGALAALSQAPYDFFAVCFISFPILVWLLDGSAPQPGRGRLRRLAAPFAIGWQFGFGYFVAGLWWVGNALLVEADLFAWALPLAVIGLPALLALFYGLATAIARAFWSDGLGRIAALAFGFGVAEWLRSFVLTGFPWNAVGHAAMPVPLAMQSLQVVGMFAVNALAVFVFAMPAVLSSARGRIAGPLIAALIVAAHLGYGWARLSSVTTEGAPALSARLVQPSIPQSDKWDAGIRDGIFATYLELSARPPVDGGDIPPLVVWPETAVPFLFTERPDGLAAIGQLLEDGQLLLAGAVRVEGALADGGRYYNSLLAVNDAGEIVDAVDKVHLVPFGEYLPFEEAFRRVGIGKLVQSVAAFSAGTHRRPIEVAPGITATAFICYEVIFPGVAGNGDIDSDILLNVTNDAWFGDTPGPYQHFRQAQLRSVEAGRPMLRVGNNGVSGAIDAHGRVIDGYALDAVGALDVALPLVRTSPPLPGSATYGGMLAHVLLLAGAGVGMMSRRRRVN